MKFYARYGLKLLRNSAFIFAISIILGLGIPSPARYSEPLITPALLLMMTFSLTEIDLRVRGDLRGALIGLAMNYILLSGLILLLSYTLENSALRYGLIVMAAVPPAVAVLPLTRLLGGDVRLSLYGEALSYGAALIFMPGIIFLFTSRTGISLQYVVELALLMILLPIIASRFVGRMRLDPVLPINLGFFLVTYTVVGLNSSAIFADIASLAAVAFARTFVIGIAVYLAALGAGVEFPKRISYTLFGSYKNLGLAAAVSVALFGHEAGIPAAVCILAENLFYILLSLLYSVRNRASLI